MPVIPHFLIRGELATQVCLFCENSWNCTLRILCIFLYAYSTLGKLFKSIFRYYKPEIIFWNFYHYPSIGMQTILILHFLSGEALKGLLKKASVKILGPPEILI